MVVCAQTVRHHYYYEEIYLYLIIVVLLPSVYPLTLSTKHGGTASEKKFLEWLLAAHARLSTSAIHTMAELKSTRLAVTVAIIAQCRSASRDGTGKHGSYSSRDPADVAHR